ncbi:hypothetical protein MRX96_035903 [Rhipicephalus microplus]
MKTRRVRYERGGEKEKILKARRQSRRELASRGEETYFVERCHLLLGEVSYAAAHRGMRRTTWLTTTPTERTGPRDWRLSVANGIVPHHVRSRKKRRFDV